MEEFSRGGIVRVVRSKAAYDPEGIIARAESRLNEARYSAVSNNCEHFAHWCATGTRESRQVRRAVTAITGLAVATVTVAGTLAFVGSLVRGSRRA